MSNDKKALAFYYPNVYNEFNQKGVATKKLAVNTVNPG